MSNLRNLGTFKISVHMLEKEQAIVRRVMSKMIILRAEFKYEQVSMVYTAHSKELFDHVKQGVVPAEYEILIDKKSGDISAKHV